MKHRSWHPIALAAALTGLAALSSAAFAADSTASSKQGNGYFSESMSVATPRGHISGTTSGQPSDNATGKDQHILDKVMGSLVGDPQLAGADIRVNVDAGKVSLEGKAKDSAQAQHAQQVAQNAAGGAAVENHLDTNS